MCSRASLALCSTCSGASCVFCPTCSRASYFSWLTCSRASGASHPTYHRVSYAVSYMPLCLTCLVLHMLLCLIYSLALPALAPCMLLMPCVFHMLTSTIALWYYHVSRDIFFLLPTCEGFFWKFTTTKIKVLVYR